MKIGVFGSGVVGQTVGLKLAQLGHSVMIGTRDPQQLDEAKGYAGSLRTWLESAGSEAAVGTFAEAAAHGELLVNATSGTGSLAALEAARAANLGTKVLLDIANPLDFSNGMPPTLTVKDTDSLAEQLQRAFPTLRIVKSLNTMSAHLMIAPQTLADGAHTVFVSGNDAQAKADVRALLETFGWRDIVDLGDLSTARGTEMLLPIWLRLWGALGTPNFNFGIVR